MTNDIKVNIKTKKRVFGSCSRGISDKDQVIGEHKVTEISGKVSIEARDKIEGEGPVEDYREILGNKMKGFPCLTPLLLNIQGVG